jgi:macrolide-specific efflux system membrane fusion protein
LELEDVQLNLISERDIAISEPGIVDEIPIKVGEIVEKDQLLAQMDVRLLNVQREAAIVEAQLAEHETRNDVDFRFAQKSLEVSQAEYERGLSANRQFPKSVSKTELDQARLVTERSRLAAEQAQQDVEAARISLRLRCKQVAIIDQRLEMMKVRAPTNGMVVEIYPQSGEFLAAGSPVARLIQLDRLRVEGFVDGRKYDRRILNAPVTLTVELPPNNRKVKFSGKVTFVSPEVNPVNAQIRIYADIENPDLRLRPGTRGKLSISLENLEQENL